RPRSARPRRGGGGRRLRPRVRADTDGARRGGAAGCGLRTGAGRPLLRRTSGEELRRRPGRATVAAARGRAYGVVLRCPDAAANASGGGGSRGDAAGARPSRRGGLPGGRRGQAARLPRGRLVVG